MHRTEHDGRWVPRPTPAVSLRAVDPADESFLRALFADVRGRMLGDLPLPPAQAAALVDSQFHAQASDYRRRFPTSDHHIVVADGVDVGRLWVDRRTEEIRLLDIAIVDTHRNRGIGTVLIRGLQDEAKATGRILGHAVDVTNDAGLRFYARLGFQVTGRLGDTHWLMGWRQAASDQASRVNTAS
ncbi:Acetyltransferase, GNAT family [Euzebya pacifica]|uniref:Acetyltransferase, GNAT family n=1 Tax=Euzebya pacifica TaxID=1608957 RepID=A0A346XZ93_9ACTN|nr:GNAT family N-acetyltransferase [Euzebya pacifica]AXV07540.1 Acetyltransferase, GNAT family [Euzebya pacifica]